MVASKTALPLLLLLAACGSTKSKPAEAVQIFEPVASGSASESVENELTDELAEALMAIGYTDTEAKLDAGNESLQGQLADLQDRIAKAQRRSREISGEIAELDASELIGAKGDALKSELTALQARIQEMRSEVNSLAESSEF